MTLAAVALLGMLSVPSPGDRLEPFVLRDMAGKPVEWSPGRTTVISVCAYWCDTWKDQAPRLEKARLSLQGLPADFLTVSIDGRWLERPTGKPLSDPGSTWSRRVGIDKVPYTLVVDPLGEIRWTRFGVARTEDLVREIRSTFNDVKGGAVYLTFDDFPSGPLDHELLDVLRAGGIKASLFVIGSKVEANREILERAIREGHRLEVHAWDHSSKDSEAPRVASVLRSFGVRPAWVRSPGQERVAAIGGRTLRSPISNPYDYRRPGSKEIIRRVIYSAKPGTIVQLHAGVGETIEALPELIRRLRERRLVPSLLSPENAAAEGAE